MNLADTHCHLDLEQFDPDRPAVLERAAAAGLTRILIPALDLASSRRVVKLAASHPMLFAAVGVHPTEAAAWNDATHDDLRALAQHDMPHRIVAIGEIGLDYYWEAAPHEIQQAALREQLGLAAELSLPVVVHLREKEDAQGGPCARDLMAMLGDWMKELRAQGNPLAERPGVLHSFSGDLATAEQALELGFHIGVTGPVTYKNAEAKRDVIRRIPLQRILIETDAPYLAPVPQRGRRNEPAFVRHIADKIAELNQITPEEAAGITSENAERLFGWGKLPESGV
jgi:TatD DNase family protein